MTAQQLLDNALALLLTSSTQTPEYADHALPLINMLLGEIGVYNNLIRENSGKTPVTELLSVAGMEEQLPCEHALAVTALPSGLCAKLLMDDDDMAKVAYFQNQFVAACEAAAQGAAKPVADVYANEVLR